MPKYRIVGNRRVDGVEPGGTVDMDAERGRALVRAGHLRLVPAKKAPAPKPDATRDVAPKTKD